MEKIREKYQAESNGRIKIHITGFAKIVGDLIEGLRQVMTFFIYSVLIATVVIFLYSGCVRSTILLITAAVRIPERMCGMASGSWT